MTNRQKIFKWLAIIVFLLAFQTFTYFTIAQRQLKNKLLPDYFATLTHHSDSVFVRDFYVSDCYTGNTDTYTSHNLSSDEAFIKQKFKVDYVHFDAQAHFNWADTSEKKYNLVYQTWTARPHWLSLFGFYGAQQTEILHTDKKYSYKRETTYHWLLFFWLPTFERFESTSV